MLPRGTPGIPRVGSGQAGVGRTTHGGRGQRALLGAGAGRGGSSSGLPLFPLGRPGCLGLVDVLLWGGGRGAQACRVSQELACAYEETKIPCSCNLL